MKINLGTQMSSFFIFYLNIFCYIYIKILILKNVKMKKLKYLIIILGLFLITSCNVRVDGDVRTDRFENNISYFQDQKTGAVFAVVTIKTGTNLVEDGVGLAYIPKSDVTPAIKRQIKNFNEKLFNYDR